MSEDLNLSVFLQTLHFLVTFEGGYIVLQGKNKDTTIFEKSEVKVFPRVSNYFLNFLNILLLLIIFLCQLHYFPFLPIDKLHPYQNDSEW